MTVGVSFVFTFLEREKRSGRKGSLCISRALKRRKEICVGLGLTNGEGRIWRGILDELRLGGPPLWDELVATWKSAWVCIVNNMC